jgi:hypothetical protein
MLTAHSLLPEEKHFPTSARIGFIELMKRPPIGKLHDIEESSFRITLDRYHLGVVAPPSTSGVIFPISMAWLAGTS